MKLKNLKLSSKLYLGFGTMTLILALAIITTITQTERAAAVTDRVVELRVPTSQASLSMLNGINHSLAALRGWMILGDESFKKERLFAWSDEIDPALDELVKFSDGWTTPKNLERLNVIRTELKKFRSYQMEIEEIAQEIRNVPSIQILLEEVVPQADLMSVSITKLIDLEFEEASTEERKRLLGMMADVRGTTGLALANIRAFLLSGDTAFQSKYSKYWEKNTRRFKDLESQLDLLTADQLRVFQEFKTARAVFDPLSVAMFESRSAEDWNLANHWLSNKAAPSAKIIVQELNEMIESQKGLLSIDVEASNALKIHMEYFEVGVLIVGILLGSCIGIVITRSITKPISLTIDELEHNASSLAASSEEISSSGIQMAEAVSEQAASLEETSSSMEEVSSMTTRNREHSEMASCLTTKARKEAQSSVELMNEMAVAMNEIQSSSNNVSIITKTIEDIAFQTNILALNAAVEAARAGEAGAGFAVVADEVRNLAQRSASAAKETTEKIGDSKRKCDQGVDICDRVNRALTAMAEGVKEIDDLVLKISKASTEQAKGIGFINTTISGMERVTQASAAGAEECSAATVEVANQAQYLMQHVSILRSVVYGETQSFEGPAPTSGGRTASAVVKVDSDFGPPRNRLVQPVEVAGKQSEDLWN